MKERCKLSEVYENQEATFPRCSCSQFTVLAGLLNPKQRRDTGDGAGKTVGTGSRSTCGGGGEGADWGDTWEFDSVPPNLSEGLLEDECGLMWSGPTASGRLAL